jgi:hypothetical protein
MGSLSGRKDAWSAVDIDDFAAVHPHHDRTLVDIDIAELRRVRDLVDHHRLRNGRSNHDALLDHHRFDRVGDDVLLGRLRHGGCRANRSAGHAADDRANRAADHGARSRSRHGARAGFEFLVLGLLLGLGRRLLRERRARKRCACKRGCNEQGLQHRISPVFCGPAGKRLAPLPVPPEMRRSNPMGFLHLPSTTRQNPDLTPLRYG